MDEKFSSKFKPFNYLLGLLGLVVYVLFGRIVIEKAYRGEAYFLNSIITSQSQYPLEYYFSKGDLFVFGIYLLWALLIASVLIYRTRSYRMFFTALISGDIIFLLLGSILGGDFDISLDRGFPEIFQYMKEISIASFLFLVFLKEKEKILLVLSGIFGYFFVDDCFRYHETVGAFLANNAYVSSIAKLLDFENEAIGEIFSLALPAFLMIALLICVYNRTGQQFKKPTKNIIYLIAILAVFGVTLDAFEKLKSLVISRHLINIIENFGEMVVMSAILAYVDSLFIRWRNGNVASRKEI